MKQSIDPIEQNQRSVPDEDSRSDRGFYKLIPRGVGFREKTHQTEIEDCKLQQVEADKRRLLRLFDYSYTSTRQYNYEKILYLKPNFILCNARPNGMEAPCEALRLLLADRDLLFNETDSVFRDRMFNGSFISMQKAKKRELNDPQAAIQQEWIEEIADEIDPAGMGETGLKPTMLLKAVVKDAKAKRRTVYDWLYSERHIAVTDRNRLEYEERYRRYPDGYYDIEKKYPEKKKEQRRFTGDIVKRENPANTWLLDVERCRETFRNLLEPERRRFLTDEFCEKFINTYLVRYMHREAFSKMKFLGENRCCDLARISVNFSDYEKRKSRLERLKKEFKEGLSCKYGGRADVIEWGRRQTESGRETENLVYEVSNKIKDFFENFKISMQKENLDILKERVRWVLESQELKEYDKREKAILFLIMINSCKKRIAQSFDVPFIVAKGWEYWIRGFSREEQRMAELRLLHQIHHILGLSWEDQIENWKDYLFFRGKSICNTAEFRFWKELLQENFEVLPCIGYQLCVCEYIKNCMPIHYETLTYKSASGAHLGGYKRFIDIHGKELENLAENSERFQEGAKEYLQCWKDPGNGGEKIRKVLKKQLPNFQSEPVFQNCPDQEIQLLALETIFRMCIVKQAKKKVDNWIKMCYDFSPLKVAC